MEQKNTEIKILKSNIKALINLADDANRRVKANAHNQEASDKKNHEAKATKMAEDIAALKKRLAELVAEHKEKEQSLRKVTTDISISASRSLACVSYARASVKLHQICTVVSLI